MNTTSWIWRTGLAAGALGATVLLTGALTAVVAGTAKACPPCKACRLHLACTDHASAQCSGAVDGEWAGNWYWMRSPEQEQRVVASLYNRYCIRCHGVDGRGVWDIPDVPDFTNQRWQASRSDVRLSRLILEGEGAVMPPFRGTLSLEEAWAMARYLRSFVPGSEVPRLDSHQPDQVPGKPQARVLEAMPTVVPVPVSGSVEGHRSGALLSPRRTPMSR